MPKLVEYPPPPSPEQTVEERWYSDGVFWFDFTHSELSVSGFHGLVHDDELLDENFDEVNRHGSELQQLVLMAFENRTSGAFRELWMTEGYWDKQIAETILLRFPRNVADEVRIILAQAEDGPDDLTEEFVQCVAMLHAYTGLPSGMKTREEQNQDTRILRGGTAGEILDRITLGPGARPPHQPEVDHP